MNYTAVWAIEEELPFTRITEPEEGLLQANSTKRSTTVTSTLEHSIAITTNTIGKKVITMTFINIDWTTDKLRQVQNVIISGSVDINELLHTQALVGTRP